MGGGEVRNGKALDMEQGKGEVKDNTVSEGYWQHPMVLQDLLEVGAAKADQEREEKEGDEEEGESFNRNCGVTVMVFCFSMIF